MVLSLLPANFAFADGADEPTTYEIATLAQLEEFRNNVNNGNSYEGAYVKLTADIELQSTSWMPIGYAKDKSTIYAFKGTFDGNGKTISGLNLEYSGTTHYEKDYKGLFGIVSGGTVKNLTVAGTIEASTSAYVGGIIGYAKDAVIENCINKCDISAVSSLGGIVGYAGGSVKIKKCINEGKISASNSSAGGIVGYVALQTEITDCENGGAVSAAKNNAGGIVGFVKEKEDADKYLTVTNCLNKGAVSANAFCGGIVGANGSSKNVTNSYYPETCISANAQNVNTLGTAVALLISNLDELKEFRKNVNNGNSYEGKCIMLTADIDMKSENWTPIGSLDDRFEGTFDGCGHKITNLSVQWNGNYAGLFGRISGASIKNLSVAGNVSGTGKIGGIVGYAYKGSIDNCTNNVKVIGSGSEVGGIVGKMSESAVRNCGNTGAVTGLYSVGGIAGDAMDSKNSIENCYNTGNITSTGSSNNGYSQIGGIVGDAYQCKISYCFNAGIITAAGNHLCVGPVVGYIVSNNTSDGNTVFYLSGCKDNNTVFNNMSVTEPFGTEKSYDAFISGEVAYLLQKGSSAQLWGQKIGTDTFPVFSSDVVYEDEYDEVKVYRNTIDGTKILWFGNDKKTATVLLDKEGTYTLVFAKYGQYGIESVETRTIEITNPQAVSVTANGALAEGDKVILWDNLTDITPHCEAYIVK